MLTPDREDGKQLLYVSPILSGVDPIEGQSIENPYISCDCPEHDPLLDSVVCLLGVLLPTEWHGNSR